MQRTLKREFKELEAVGKEAIVEKHGNGNKGPSGPGEARRIRSLSVAVLGAGSLSLSQNLRGVTRQGGARTERPCSGKPSGRNQEHSGTHAGRTGRITQWLEQQGSAGISCARHERRHREKTLGWCKPFQSDCPGRGQWSRRLRKRHAKERPGQHSDVEKGTGGQASERRNQFRSAAVCRDPQGPGRDGPGGNSCGRATAPPDPPIILKVPARTRAMPAKMPTIVPSCNTDQGVSRECECKGERNPRHGTRVTEPAPSERWAL